MPKVVFPKLNSLPERGDSYKEKLTFGPLDIYCFCQSLNSCVLIVINLFVPFWGVCFVLEDF